RRAHHRPQRGTDAGHRGSRIHHVRGPRAGGRHGAGAGLRRPGVAGLPRSDPHRPVAGADGGGVMRQGLGQHTGLRQELRVNPRLYQAMDLLYMPMMDLQQHLKQELLGNPFLELVEPEEEEGTTEKTAETEKAEKEKEDEVDWEESLLKGCGVGRQRV